MCATYDDDLVQDEQDQKYDRADGEVPADHELSEGLDDLARG